MSETATTSDALAAREFTLSSELAAAVAEVSGLTVPGAGVLNLEELPLEQLREAGLLEPTRDVLRDDLAAALRVIADPVCAVTIATTVPEQQLWERLVAFGGPDEGDGFAAISTQPGTTVVVSMPTAAGVADAAITPLLLGRLAAPEGETSRLGIAGWSALLAIADIHRERELKAVLARDTKPPPESFNDRDLAQAATRGASGNDLRWLCTLGLAMTPLPLPRERPALEDGIEQLVAAGLAASDGKGLTLTSAGAQLHLILRTVMVAGSLGATRIGGDDTELAMAGVLSSPLGALAVVWEDVRETDATVALLPINAAGFVAVVGQLAEFARTVLPRKNAPDIIGAPMPADAAVAVSAPDPATACASCGAGMSGDEKFCSSCGKAVKVPAVCPSCGASIRPGAAFCTKCGQNLAS